MNNVVHVELQHFRALSCFERQEEYPSELLNHADLPTPILRFLKTLGDAAAKIIAIVAFRAGEPLSGEQSFSVEKRLTSATER
jgi:hypothetical protein